MGKDSQEDREETKKELKTQIGKEKINVDRKVDMQAKQFLTDLVVKLVKELENSGGITKSDIGIDKERIKEKISERKIFRFKER